MLINYISIQLKGLLRIVFTVASALLILTFSLDVNAKTTAKKISFQDNNHFMEQVLAMQVEQNEDMLVTMQVVNMKLADALKLLAEKLRVGISFHTEVMPDKRVSLNITNAPVYEVLFKLLEGTGLEPALPPSKDVIVIREIEQNQLSNDKFQEIVRGTVVDAQTGESLPGVNIIIAGTSTGTTTNLDGQFELTVPNLQETLIFTYIGYESKIIEIDGNEQLQVALVQDIIAGDELVVVGYGVQRRSDVTGSVASVDRRDLVSEPVYSIDNVLQGRAAGVQVMTNGFRPGESATIRIRGNRSFEASNDPLFVVDGIPMDGGLQDINPQDVESVEVLKDASATAIYGSRGANGVVLVTTRRGQGGLSVEYSGYTGIQYTFNRLDVMDTAAYAEFVRDAHRLQGTYTGNDLDIFETYEMEAINQNRTTDWQDLVFNRGIQQNHSLSIRGASNGTRYAISGVLDDHRATVKNNDYTRHSFRANIDQEISSNISIGLSGSVNNSVKNQSVNFLNVVGNFPLVTAYDSENNLRMYDERGDRNPLFDIENNVDRTNRTRVLGTLYAQVNLLSDRLSFRTNFSPDLIFSERGIYRQDQTSEASLRNNRDTSFLFEGIVNYNDVFINTHRFNITALYSIQNQSSQSLRLDVAGLPYERQQFYNMASADRVDHRSSGLTEWALESYMLRMNYVYDDRYLLTFTGRVDGSSRLSPGNKYGLFPSMAAAWQIGNERFMQNTDVFSDLKLRISVGDVGNTAIRPYQTQGALSLVEVVLDSETLRAFELSDIPNPDLKWERTRSIDIGLDFALFEHRVSGSIDVYQSDTRDLLMVRQLPATSGYTQTLENVGETRNRGFELAISSVNVSTNNFMWSTNFNFSTNRNEIVSLYGGKEDDVGSGWFIGESINAHYWWDMIGIWQLNEAQEAAQYGRVPGDRKFRDVTGDGTYGANDRVILGNSDPSWTAGINNRINFKNLDFSIMVYTVQGVLDRAFFGSASPNGLLSMRADPQYTNNLNVNYWTPDNPTNKYPRPRFGSPGAEEIRAQEYMDLSFVRIRNITIGYSLPIELQSRLGTRSARIYASVQNPFTFTSFEGYDPEGATGADMPNYTTFLLGVNLGF